MHPEEETAYYESPAGWIKVCARPEGISSLIFSDPEPGPNHNSAVNSTPSNKMLAECLSQLKQYFAGQLSTFTLPLAPSGTEFQLKVWAELVKIPYGQVITYRDLGKRLGGPNYTRIVGQANSRNPISILIPCHRVIGMNGALTGYAGGLWRKKFLLELEQKGNRTDYRPTLFGND